MNGNDPIRFRRSADTISQEIGEETVILDLSGEVYFGLNEVGTRVWQMLESECDIDDLVQTLLEEFNVAESVLKEDVSKLLKELHDAALVEPT